MATFAVYCHSSQIASANLPRFLPAILLIVAASTAFTASTALAASAAAFTALARGVAGDAVGDGIVVAGVAMRRVAFVQIDEAKRL